VKVDIELMLVKYARLVDHFILEHLSGTPESLYQAALHLVKAGGKRLRPAIAMLVANMLGGIEAESRALPLAAAIEVSHTFTLIHDDIMDRDDYRRGVPTVHKLWGESWAILAGDLLHAYAYKFIVSSVDHGLSKSEAHEAMKVLTTAGIKVSRGQAYDLLLEKTLDVTVADYLDMVYHKTGAIMEASAKLGAVAARAESEVVELLGQYGSLLGVAFQVRDDYLGMFGDPEKTGKPIYSDLRRGKKTLLAIYALSKLKGEEREFLVKLLDPNTPKSLEDLERGAMLVKESGAADEALRLSRVYADRAKEILLSLRNVVNEDAREALLVLTEYAITRDR
jgi:geranylgeranyl diphosphate synthase type I